MNNTRIIRALSANMSYAETLALARRAAPLLEIRVSEFMRLRSNR